MVQVAFHFGVAEKLGYASRLLRKAFRNQTPVIVWGQATELETLSQKLWAISAEDFVPHCFASDAIHLVQNSPIILASETVTHTADTAVLVNLNHQVPPAFERYARLIEIVSSDETDRSHARARWKHYAQHGASIQRHDAQHAGES